MRIRSIASVIPLVLGLLFSSLPTRAETVVAAGLGHQMGSGWALTPTTCEWEVQLNLEGRGLKSYWTDGLVWNIQDLGLAGAFYTRLRCLAVGYPDEPKNWSQWSGWSKRIYLGPENDIDGDGKMDESDLDAFRAAWLSTTNNIDRYNPAADFDHNGAVGMSDFVLLRVVWGRHKEGNRWVY